MEVDFRLDCPGSRDEDCSVWDHCLTLTTQCSDGSGSSHPVLTGEPGGAPTELWRGITAFKRRTGQWITDVTPLFGLLTSSNCSFTMQVGGETWVTGHLRLRFSQGGSDGPTTLPFAFYHCDWENPSTSFKGPDYNANRTLLVSAPEGAVRAQVVAIISGHGNCEFQPTSHHFVVNGQDFNTSAIAHDMFILAGSSLGCTMQVPQGSVPNEHGTWYYGRNGWCDGMDVKPLVWDVSEAALGAGPTFNLTYFALSYNVGGSNPSQKGCGGGIIMQAAVAFYST